MKTLSNTLVAATALFLFSCSNGDNNTSAETASQPAASVSNESSSAANPTDLKLETLPTAETSAETPSPAASNVALNPAHGEPGHNCAIPVGAPLDGSSSGTVSMGDLQITPLPDNNTSSQPAQTASSAAPAPSSSGTPMLNPPHGQPGHDCAVPVGEPLNASARSSIQTAPAPAAKSNTAPQQTHITSVPRFNPAAAQTGAVAAGTNPPHGQPGHDCAIPVGAPLNR